MMLRVACLLLLTSIVAAQSADRSSEWLTFAYDVQRTGWNRAETELSPANIGQLHQVWHTALPNRAHVLAGLSAPLLVNHGGRDLLIVAGSDDHVFALDAATGERIWQRDFLTDAKPAAEADWLCPNALTATPVIDKAHARVFAVAADGRLYTLALDDGRVIGPGIRFLPAFSKMWSLTYLDGTVFSTTSQDCNGGRSGVWAVNPDAPGRPVNVLYTAANCTKSFCGGGVWGRGGVATDGAGHLYFATGDAAFDPSAGQWGTTVMKADARSLDVQDWFVPKNRDIVDKLDLDLGNSSNVVFSWRGRQLTAVGGKEGVIYLMDTAALGGPDHQTIAWTSPLFSNDKRSFQKHGIWGSLSAWTDPSGRVWLFIPTYGPTAAAQASSFPHVYGDDPNGSIQAFTVEADAEGQPHLQPQWRSRDLKMPDPVAVANGLVFALATGEDATQATVDLITDVKWGPGGSILDEKERQRLHQGGHATLYALDATTGRELWSSGSAIADWTHFSMPVVAAGRAFVTTNSGHVYAFGLGPVRGDHTYAPPSTAPSPATATPPPSSGGTGALVNTAAQALFTSHCSQCHGAHGEGRASAHTPDMHAPEWQRARTDEVILTAIREGMTGGMPPFGQVLTAEEIRTLAAYVRSLR